MIISNYIFFNYKKLLTTKHFVIRALGIFSFIPFLLFFLTGCVGMRSKFDCNVDSGGRCAPMHHINQMANHGTFAEKSFKANKLMLTKKKGNKNIQNIYKTTPIRSNEKIQQIWIGPYEDASGNYHEGTYIYVVVKKSKWINK